MRKTINEKCIKSASLYNNLIGSFHANSTNFLGIFNPQSWILTKFGAYITPTLVRNYAKYFFPRPHSFVHRRDQNFKNFPILAIF